MSRPERRSGEDDEVVGVDEVLRGAVGEVGAAPAGHRRGGPGIGAHQPLREDRAVRRRRSPRRRRPRSDRAPRSRRRVAATRPRVRAPGAAPASTTRVPVEPTAKAIQSLRAGRSRSWGNTTVPTPGAPGHGVGEHLLPRAAAMTVRTPDQAAILAAAILEAMPPLPPVLPGPPASDSRAWSTSTISSMSDADGSRRGSADSRPGVSVSRTSSPAPTRWATSAARRSLSPKRISSSATASFSLTTGTAPSSRRRRTVPRAWRY